MFDNLPASLRRLSDIVEEYDAKKAAIPDSIQAYAMARGQLETAACIGGSYGGSIWSNGGGAPYESTVAAVLLKSAWKHVLDGLNIRQIATAKDLSRLDTSLENPPPFTLDTLRATLGKYLLDPRQHMLRGIAEAFCDLDPAYKSHSKVKIGVAGLPKRIIISDALSKWNWRGGQMKNVLDAMASLNTTPRLEYAELEALKSAAKRGDDPQFLGVTLRGFQNGNMHLIFDADSLRLINLALAEYYGDVLPDTPDEAPKKQASTALSKDLQFYPTPGDVCKEVLSHLSFKDGESILEPSCGDGRFLDALRALRKGLSLTGVECHGGRADEARAKGHHVQTANFLQVAPQPTFDKVVMNPPFYGRHYMKHVRHALKFLKPDGLLLAVLPATARYDHGEFTVRAWHDLPVGSFAESGTNVPTGFVILGAGWK